MIIEQLNRIALSLDPVSAEVVRKAIKRLEETPDFRVKLTKAQADEIEAEIRKVEANRDTTVTQMRLLMQSPMPCGHAYANLLICPDPPYGCVICGEPKR